MLHLIESEDKMMNCLIRFLGGLYEDHKSIEGGLFLIKKMCNLSLSLAGTFLVSLKSLAPAHPN